MNGTKIRLLFIARKPTASTSIELVFRQVAKRLDPERFEVDVQTVEYGNGLAAIIKNLLFFRPRQADIYHVTGDIHYLAAILPIEKTVLTIHDLVFLHYSTGIRRSVLKKIFLDLPLRKLRYVTCVSAATRDEVVRETGTDPQKITVIHNPLLEDIQHAARKAANDIPVVLHIGTAWNKNLERVIAAVRGLNVKLKIIGRLTANSQAILRNSGIVYENRFAIGRDAIRSEYENADVLEFCSIYEGFGLPIIEAQALKVPVLTSSIAPMNVVAGEGAAFADPYEPNSMRAELEKLLTDRTYRENIVQAGLRNIERFDPKAISDCYADLYEKVVMGTESVGPAN